MIKALKSEAKKKKKKNVIEIRCYVCLDILF